jgi:hypothetical protein
MEIEKRLSSYVDELIEALTMSEAIREGAVTTTGPSPYRRLDCDGRALAYIRVRPKKRGVRVDVSGLWIAPYVSRLKIAGAGGAASLFLRTHQDVRDAAHYLNDTIEHTRATLGPDGPDP